MREIKFRGWDVEFKKMYLNVHFDDLEVWWENEVLGDRNPGGLLAHIEIMQFTGLKDKNGVDIYERDILKGEYEIGAVEYCDNLGVFYWPPGEDWGMIVSKRVEVIGNIYENPDLLEDYTR